MSPWILSIILKPIGLILLFGIAYFVKKMVWLYFPDNKLKRILFYSWKI